MRSGSKPWCWKKALVFGRSHRVNEHFRDIRELDQPPLLAVPVEKIRDQLRLQLVLPAHRIVAQRDDLRDAPVGELNQARLLVEIRIRARENLDTPIQPHLERTDGVAALFAVAAAPQFGRDVARRGGVAGRDQPRRRKDLGSIRKRAGPQLLVDQVRVFRVVVGENPSPRQEHEHERNRQGLAEGMQKEPDQVGFPRNPDRDFPLLWH